MTEKLDLVYQHASKDRGAATAGRVANQERQRIERSEVIQTGQEALRRGPLAFQPLVSVHSVQFDGLCQGSQ